MKSKAAICAIAAASLGFASLSFAQGYEPRGPMGHDGRNSAQRGFDPRHDHNGPNGGPRGFDHRDARRDSYHGARGPQYYRGGRIPAHYRNRQYVVSNWRAHHLYAPHRGQQWVQVGSDYVLIAIATGVIAQLVLSR
ncbi:MAG: RcnB family protein [Polaromonas sp.]